MKSTGRWSLDRTKSSWAVEHEHWRALAKRKRVEMNFIVRGRRPGRLADAGKHLVDGSEFVNGSLHYVMLNALK